MEWWELLGWGLGGSTLSMLSRTSIPWSSPVIKGRRAQRKGKNVPSYSKWERIWSHKKSGNCSCRQDLLHCTSRSKRTLNTEHWSSYGIWNKSLYQIGESVKNKLNRKISRASLAGIAHGGREPFQKHYGVKKRAHAERVCELPHII